MKIRGHATGLNLYAVIISKRHQETMLGCIEVRCDKSIKINFLAICTNTLSHVQNCIAVNTCVNILWAGKWCKYKLLTEHDTDFHNLIIIDLLYCMPMNRTLHIMHAIVINGFVNKKIGG
jgi:hypothetical protein